MKGIITENGVLLGKGEIIRTNALEQYTIDGVVFGEWLGKQYIIENVPDGILPGVHQLINGNWKEREDVFISVENKEA